jgi:NADH-quinone oxidoreductase subunit J
MEVLISILGIGAVYSGLMVISSKNPVHSVFYLVLAFANTSILLLIKGVEFLSLLFLIVYVGAIAILFLFVVMMLNIKLVEIIDNTTRYVPIGFIIGIVFLSMIISILNIGDLNFNINPTLPSEGVENQFDISLLNIVNHTNIEALGFILYTDYFLFFIIASFILLVAMIGAIVLTIYHEEGVRRQDLFSQVATEYHKTVILSS